jgi:hypothetical protein
MGQKYYIILKGSAYILLKTKFGETMNNIENNQSPSRINNFSNSNSP